MYLWENQEKVGECQVALRVHFWIVWLLTLLSWKTHCFSHNSRADRSAVSRASWCSPPLSCCLRWGKQIFFSSLSFLSSMRWIAWCGNKKKEWKWMAFNICWRPWIYDLDPQQPCEIQTSFLPFHHQNWTRWTFLLASVPFLKTLSLSNLSPLPSFVFKMLV